MTHVQPSVPVIQTGRFKRQQQHQVARQTFPDASGCPSQNLSKNGGRFSWHENTVSFPAALGRHSVLSPPGSRAQLSILWMFLVLQHPWRGLRCSCCVQPHGPEAKGSSSLWPDAAFENCRKTSASTPKQTCPRQTWPKNQWTIYATCFLFLSNIAQHSLERSNGWEGGSPSPGGLCRTGALGGLDAGQPSSR